MNKIDGDHMTFVLTVKQMLSEFFLFKRYPLNLYLSILGEILLSFHEGGCQYFCKQWELMPEREFIHLSQHYDLGSIQRVIVVGGGALPYTALYFSRHTRKPVYAIERNAASYLACLRLIRELKATDVSVIKESGELYRHYDSSLVIIVLHTRLKQDVLKKVLNSKCIVVIRLPLEETNSSSSMSTLLT